MTTQYRSSVSSATTPQQKTPTRTLGRMLAVFAAFIVLAGTGLLVHWSWPAAKALEGREAPAVESVPRVPVVQTPAREMLFENSIVVSGSVMAKNCALVSARLPGVLDAIFVDRGDLVQADQTQLFQTDSLKLTKAVAIARQGLQVAELSVQEKDANLEQALATKELAELDLERYRALLGENAVPRQLFDQQVTRFRQSSAMVRHAATLLALDKSKLEQARLQLLVAEKDLADSLVLAPISGKISQRFMEPGEMAGPGSPVVRIEDLSLLEVCVFLPEEHYPQVESEQTQMRIIVSGIDLGSRPVTYKSPTINPKLRTFEIKSQVANPPQSVASGGLAEVTVVMDSRVGIGIPSSAIQQRGGKSVVFVIQDDSARMVPVETGRTAAGWTEILDSGWTVGSLIVTMGQQQLSEGRLVSVAREDAR
jgi:RND family efflux transporter MFP subunit